MKSGQDMARKLQVSVNIAGFLATCPMRNGDMRSKYGDRREYEVLS